MSQAEMPKIGNSTVDVVTSLTKGTVGAVPFVGSLIAEVVGNIIPNQRIDRIGRFVELLEERLKNVEEATLHKKLVEPPTVDLLEDAFIQASRATSQERLEHIANVVAIGISAEELNEAETKRMLWLLGQLNDSEIIILRSKLVITRDDMEADTEFREKHEQLLSPDTTHMGSSEAEFEEVAIRGSYRQHVQDLGLTRPRFSKPRRGELPEFDDKTGMVKSSGSDVTRLGKMLLRYLNLIPPWYQH